MCAVVVQTVTADLMFQKALLPLTKVQLHKVLSGLLEPGCAKWAGFNWLRLSDWPLSQESDSRDVNR